MPLHFSSGISRRLIPIRQFNNQVCRKENQHPQHQRRDAKGEEGENGDLLTVFRLVDREQILNGIFKATPYLINTVKNDDKSSRSYKDTEQFRRFHWDDIMERCFGLKSQFNDIICINP